MVTWSYSGEIGIHAMLRRPDLFRSAVHYDPVLDAMVEGTAGGANATRELFARFGPAIGAARENRSEDAALRFIEAVFELPDGGAVGEAGEQMWRDNGRTVPLYLAMKPPQAIDCESLGELTAPTLVVQGADSFTWFSIMSERVASCVANGLIVTMPGVNHDGPYRRPGEFGAIIESFTALNE
jgi:pimeloyl-ACP methyl ester carboxylesterase